MSDVPDIRIPLSSKDPPPEIEDRGSFDKGDDHLSFSEVSQLYLSEVSWRSLSCLFSNLLVILLEQKAKAQGCSFLLIRAGNKVTGWDSEFELGLVNIQHIQPWWSQLRPSSVMLPVPEMIGPS